MFIGLPWAQHTVSPGQLAELLHSSVKPMQLELAGMHEVPCQLAQHTSVTGSQLSSPQLMGSTGGLPPVPLLVDVDVDVDVEGGVDVLVLSPP